MNKEKEIRTPTMRIMMCTAKKEEDGRIKLHKKDGKKEEDMYLDQFVSQVYEIVNEPEL